MPIKFKLQKDSTPKQGYLIDNRRNHLCQLLIGIGSHIQISIRLDQIIPETDQEDLSYLN